jgi:uncharacterized membrane protein
MRKISLFALLMVVGLVLVVTSASAFKMPSWGNDKFTKLSPKNGVLSIPVKNISDGKAHYFKVMADDGVIVSFFTLKSKDNVIRAAIDACDVCYKAGKGYIQDGDFMICENCGQRFASNRINVIKGGCNPAPLNRVVQGDKLVIQMKDINTNSWYCRYKKS